MGETKTLPITWRSDSTSQEYERARVGRVFNHRRPNRFPVAVVEAENEEHIQQAVHIAQRRDLRISVRSSGHSWAAWSVRDNAVLIDLGNYKQIELDETTGIVTVSPSTTGTQLNTILREKGLMFPGGHCPDVGLGGFLLQGGMEWVCRSWGWACQYVKAIDVVTANSHRLHCSEKENGDLFWAARGAGPGFPAIVTRFYLHTKPLPTHIRSSAYIFPKALLKTALTWIMSITETYDEDTEIVCVGRFIPDYDDRVVIIGLTTFKYSDNDAISALKSAEDSLPRGYLQRHFANPTSLHEQYIEQALANPEGHRYCSDNAYIDNNSDVAGVLEETFTTLPSRKSFSLWYAMAPTSRRKLPDMALSMKSDHYLTIYLVWESSEDDDKCQSWVANVMNRMAPHSDHGKRLMKIREKWNPNGRICGYLDSGDQSGVKGI
ncbi:FAD-binding domain-containing protein [Lizonia empirigonia]|nr:FAD-binding domain-containing protein [Lizonia empirigonia]